MKIRVRQPRLQDTKRKGKVCPCCARLSWKFKVMDKVALKEAVQEMGV